MMSGSTRPQPGRPRNEGELADVRKPVLFTASESRELDAFFQRDDVNEKRYGTFVHDLVMNVVRGKVSSKPVDIDWANLSADSFRAPYLSGVPCGPWREAVEGAQSFTISRETADELEAQEGDVFLRADGESMDGAGIQDGFLVLVRPYRSRAPRRGDIVLVQVTTQDNECLGTLKRWNGQAGNALPRLLDGNDDEFPLPGNVVKVDILARAVGTLGRI